jgi:type II secretory pathway pseudopilin PulG
MIKKFRNYQAGMTYVELIVVLSIFSTMTSILLFNYNGFQEKVDIKVLANDIASKIIEAQKFSIAGKWNINAPLNWKPSYGIYFDTSNADNKKEFVYFVDLNQDGFYTTSNCLGTAECLDRVIITKGNFISEIGINGVGCPATVSNLNIIFKRPDSSAIITSTPALVCNISYVQIVISSPELISSSIKIYPSGRIQIN